MGLLDFRSKRDVKRLQDDLPALGDYDAQASRAEKILRDKHAQYVASVSTDLAAASLNLCKFLWVLCDAIQPRRIVDLGSGFSSYLLRSWAAQSELDPAPEVWSVDDAPQWLDKTREFLAAEGLTTENVLSWDEFDGADRGQFDLVFHDMGSMPTRVRTFDKAISLARPGGAIVLDDVHKRKKYRLFVAETLKKANLDYYDLKNLLLDEFGRYAWLVIRPADGDK